MRELLTSLICFLCAVGAMAETADFDFARQGYADETAIVSGDINECLSFRFTQHTTVRYNAAARAVQMSASDTLYIHTRQAATITRVECTLADGDLFISSGSNPSVWTGKAYSYVHFNAHNTCRVKSLHITYSPARIVHFEAGSGLCSTDSLTEKHGGDGVACPTAAPDGNCKAAGWEFIGWSSKAIADKNKQPNYLYEPGETRLSASNDTLYAVYALIPADQNERYTTLSTPLDNYCGTYVIAHGGVALSGLDDTKHTATAATFLPSADFGGELCVGYGRSGHCYLRLKNVGNIYADGSELHSIADVNLTKHYWDVTSEGGRLVLHPATDAARSLQFDTGSKRFVCATNGQYEPVTLYRKAYTTYSNTPTAPAVPQDMEASDITDHSFTVSWQPSADAVTYRVRVYAIDTLNLLETFAFNDGTGGNDDRWEGSIATKQNYYTDLQWTGEKVSGALNCVKLGTTSAAGSLTSQPLPPCEATVSFRAGAWAGDADSLRLVASKGILTYQQRSCRDLPVDIGRAKWTTRSVSLNSSDSLRLTFASMDTKKSRFFLDDIRIIGTSKMLWKDVIINQCSHQLTGLKPGGTYHIRVHAVNADGVLSGASDRLVVKTSTSSDIHQTPSESLPMDGTVILNPAHQVLSIYSATGQLITSTNAHFDLHNLPYGLYFIRQGNACTPVIHRASR